MPERHLSEGGNQPSKMHWERGSSIFKSTFLRETEAGTLPMLANYLTAGTDRHTTLQSPPFSLYSHCSELRLVLWWGILGWEYTVICESATCQGESKLNKEREGEQAQRVEQSKGNWCGDLRGESGYLGPVSSLSDQSHVLTDKKTKLKQNIWYTPLWTENGNLEYSSES